MTFNRKEIPAKYIGIIDIGTYKIRVGICEILNRNVELVGYGEKRQDINDIDLLEIKNLEGVCENIKQAVNKAEIDAKMKVADFIINVISPNLFFESSKINFVREKDNIIDEKEAYEILKDLENQAFRNHYKRIKNSTGYGKNDLKLIISDVLNLTIDSEIITKNLIGTNPKNINLSILNIFITENKFELKNYIAKAIKKNITNIIPTEFALLSLFHDKKNVIIIDLGNSHISIIVKKDNFVLGAKKLSFGINDLIKRIRKNYNLTKIDIITKIDEDNFQIEKTEFLEIFKDILAITLEDILKNEICPESFFMTGGGANKFIKKYLEETNFNSYNLKMSKSIRFVSPKIDFIDDKITENPDWIDGAKSNLNIYAMIKTTLDFIKKDKNKIERTLKEIVKEIN
ncbi:MAG: hypothetical protein PHH98_04980 [Candidatus Gracilibacteria bacterium]|nr:hypothetical protein [Candidatus Gracilibacteria bacterium]